MVIERFRRLLIRLCRILQRIIIDYHLSIESVADFLKLVKTVGLVPPALGTVQKVKEKRVYVR